MVKSFTQNNIFASTTPPDGTVVKYWANLTEDPHGRSIYVPLSKTEWYPAFRQNVGLGITTVLDGEYVDTKNAAFKPINGPVGIGSFIGFTALDGTKTLYAIDQYNKSTGKWHVRDILSINQSAIDDQISSMGDELRALINALDSRLSAEMSALDSRLSGEISSLDSRLTQEIIDLGDDIDQRIINLDNSINQRITNLDNDISQKIIDLDTKFSQDITDLDTKFTNQIGDLRDELTDDINDLDTALANKITILENKVDDNDIKSMKYTTGFVQAGEFKEILTLTKGDGTTYSNWISERITLGGIGVDGLMVADGNGNSTLHWHIPNIDWNQVVGGSTYNGAGILNKPVLDEVSLTSSMVSNLQTYQIKESTETDKFEQLWTAMGDGLSVIWHIPDDNGRRKYGLVDSVWHNNTELPRLDYFTIEQINNDGSVHIGGDGKPGPFTIRIRKSELADSYNEYFLKPGQIFNTIEDIAGYNSGAGPLKKNGRYEYGLVDAIVKNSFTLPNVDNETLETYQLTDPGEWYTRVKDGGITNNKIADDTISLSKIKGTLLNIIGNSGDKYITMNDSAETIAGIGSIRLNYSSQSGIVQTNTILPVVDNSSIESVLLAPPSRISTIRVKDSGIKTAHIADGAVTLAKLDNFYMTSPATSSTNVLANVDFVNSSITNMAARFITPNAAGGQFATNAALQTGPYYYHGTVDTPTNNDYAIVQNDETQSTLADGSYPTTRYVFVDPNKDGAGVWQMQYIINNTAFTSGQLSAINSGITSDKVSHIVYDNTDQTIDGIKTFTTSPTVPAKSSAASSSNTTVLATEAQVASKMVKSITYNDVSASGGSANGWGSYNGVFANPLIVNYNDDTSTSYKILEGRIFSATQNKVIVDQLMDEMIYSMDGNIKVVSNQILAPDWNVAENHQQGILNKPPIIVEKSFNSMMRSTPGAVGLWHYNSGAYETVQGYWGDMGRCPKFFPCLITNETTQHEYGMGEIENYIKLPPISFCISQNGIIFNESLNPIGVKNNRMISAFSNYMTTDNEYLFFADILAPDWNTTDPQGPDYIKNKPTKLSQFENDLPAVDLSNYLKLEGGNRVLNGGIFIDINESTGPADPNITFRSQWGQGAMIKCDYYNTYFHSYNGFSFSANGGIGDIVFSAMNLRWGDNTIATVNQLPTVNNPTITIQQNGATVDSFTLNQSTDKTINIPQANNTSSNTIVQDLEDTAIPQTWYFSTYNSTLTESGFENHIKRVFWDSALFDIIGYGFTYQVSPAIKTKKLNFYQGGVLKQTLDLTNPNGLDKYLDVNLDAGGSGGSSELPDSGVIAGVHDAVVVNSKGIVTEGRSLSTKFVGNFGMSTASIQLQRQTDSLYINSSLFKLRFKNGSDYIQATLTNPTTEPTFEWDLSSLSSGTSSGSYLPLSGGTMTGNIVFVPPSTSAGITFRGASGSVVGSIMGNNSGIIFSFNNTLTFAGSSDVTFSSANVYAYGFYQSSKRELKEEIESFSDNALDIINNVDVVKFKFIADEKKAKHIGIIADDTHELIAGENHDGFDHGNTIGLLMKAVQELSAKVKELEDKLNSR